MATTATRFFVILGLALFVAHSNAQFEGLQLAGASGTYGEGVEQWTFCQDIASGWYNYIYPLGFGFGSIEQTPGGGWRAEGVWAECGSMGQEIIDFSTNGTVNDDWWFEHPGDGAEFGSPLIIEKSKNSTIPGAEQCWWLNKNVSVDFSSGIQGLWEVRANYTLDICVLGSKYARAAYNESTDGVNFAGYISGANFANVLLTGSFVEVKQASDGCLQGCELVKLGGDGNLLFEKFWCTLNSSTDPFGFTENHYNRSSDNAGILADDSSENPECYFAALPTYGWTTMELANVTFP
jgi:hypothetical protein